MKLDQLNKKSIYHVPDGYFEHLPSKIQERIAEKKSQPSFVYAYKFQLAAVAIVIAFGLAWYLPNREPVNAESILATIETEDLIAYLNDSDLSTEELLEEAKFDMIDATEIESAIYDLPAENEEELNDLLNNIDLDTI